MNPATKITLIITTLASIVVWVSAITFPSSNLQLISCDVGQGDATLVQYKSDQILIDAGPGSKVIDCLDRHMPFWDRSIEIAILSHPELDHYEGFIEVFKRYNVGSFISTGSVSSNQSFQVLENLIGGSGTNAIVTQSGQKVRLGLIYLDIFYPSSTQVLGATSSTDPNSLSLSFVLSYKEFEGVFTGDLGLSDLNSATIQLQNIEYLKVPHHGSKNGLTESFLSRLNPAIAVISSGKNPWGHPHKEVLDMLNSAGVTTYRTDQVGDVVVTTDGKNVWMR